ncbi:MAG: ornithine cyclodeaminase family protein [Sphingosinicella sp.]
MRQIADMGAGKLFGVMPGMLPGASDFGAKLLGVFPVPAESGRSRHHGIVILFDGETAETKALADAESVTQIRTGCASAAATDALACADACRLGVFGCGVQARSHALAISRVRNLERIGIWARNLGSAERLAAELADELSVEIVPVGDAEALARDSDIICTVTASRAPILLGAWVRPGTHVNAVGSSFAGPVEVDSDLVVNSRYFVEYRRSAMAAAAEFLAARERGLIGDDHILAEIGEVHSGRASGRTSPDDITLYKSLGHIAQDLAAMRYLLERQG